MKNRGRAHNARLQGAWVWSSETLNLDSTDHGAPTDDIKHTLVVITLRCPQQRENWGRDQVQSGCAGVKSQCSLFPGRSSELFPPSREQGTSSCVVSRTVRPRGDEKVTSWVHYWPVTESCYPWINLEFPRDEGSGVITSCL